tara:strand:- start:761 stop:934 length:174 start_codon:yes stop_codon:yes gene_type:complete
MAAMSDCFEAKKAAHAVMRKPLIMMVASTGKPERQTVPGRAGLSGRYQSLLPLRQKA